MIEDPNSIIITDKKREIVQSREKDFPYSAIEARLELYPGKSTSWHWHDHFEFGIVKSGALEMYTQQGCVRIYPGQGYFLNSKVLHLNRVAQPEDCVCLHAQLFSRELLSGTGLVSRKYVAPVENCVGLEMILLDESNAQEREIMQEINAAYDMIKNPDKNTKTNPGAGWYDPFGGAYQTQQDHRSHSDRYLDSAMQYLRFSRYKEALNALNLCTERSAKWYYISALANHGLDNQVTAMEHIRRAVSMDPDNPEYLRVLEVMENGGNVYRQQAGNFQGFSMGGNPCTNLCLCYLAQMLCCGRPYFFCC